MVPAYAIRWYRNPPGMVPEAARRYPRHDIIGANVRRVVPEVAPERYRDAGCGAFSNLGASVSLFHGTRSNLWAAVSPRNGNYGNL